VYRELASREEVKGEIVVVVGPRAEARGEASPDEIRSRYAELLAQGLGRGEALKRTARDLGVPRRVAYQTVHGKGR